MIQAAIGVLGIGLAVVVLYEAGLLPLSMKRAMMYVGSMSGHKASFQSCTGSIRRVVRFRKDGFCIVRFCPELVQGEMCVEILDKNKNQAVYLDDGVRQMRFEVRKKERYCLIIRFEAASGKYELFLDQNGAS